MISLAFRMAVMTVGLAVISACSQSAPTGRPNFGNRQQLIPSVEAVEVIRGRLPLEERLAGSVRARNQTDIYAEVSGPIVEVLANDGDFVEAGQELVRIRNNDYEARLNQAVSGLEVAEARVRQAEANATRARATLNRTQAMADRNLISTADLETAQADAASAEADLSLMRAQRDQAASVVSERRSELAETVVKAPISGVVGGRNAEVGQLANTTQPLFVIGDIDSMRVSVTLTQRMLGYIQAGTGVELFTDAAPDQSIGASITRISPFLHPVARTTTAEIEVNQHGGLLRPGMFVTVDVQYGESDVAALVPNSAIYRHPRDGREGVYATSLLGTGNDAENPDIDALPALRSGLVPSGPVAVTFVPVDVVARGRLSSAISGVESGEWVVTLGHHLLSSGEAGQALIQPTPWDHIMRLQQMQTRDLLNIIRARQDALESEPETLN
jgi:RND family efflux transporter MFP subunit